MRHVVSLLLGLVSAPLIWLLTVAGLSRVETATLDDRTVFGYLLLVLAGVVCALLLVPRGSPLGAFLAGLLLAGAGLWELFGRQSFDRVLPDGWPTGTALALPVPGVLAVLAVPLLATVLAPDRWRRTTPSGAPFPAGQRLPAVPVPAPVAAAGVAPQPGQPVPYQPAPPWHPTGYPYGSPAGPHPLAEPTTPPPAEPPPGYPPLQPAVGTLAAATMVDTDRRTDADGTGTGTDEPAGPDADEVTRILPAGPAELTWPPRPLRKPDPPAAPDDHDEATRRIAVLPRGGAAPTAAAGDPATDPEVTTVIAAPEPDRSVRESPHRPVPDESTAAADDPTTRLPAAPDPTTPAPTTQAPVPTQAQAIPDHTARAQTVHDPTVHDPTVHDPTDHRTTPPPTGDDEETRTLRIGLDEDTTRVLGRQRTTPPTDETSPHPPR